jgi:hypothetical protein
MAVAVVDEESVSSPHRRHVEIRKAVVVDVDERGRHADAILERHPRRLGDVAKPSPAQVLPELAPAELVDEVDVLAPVAVDVRGGDPVPVVVVDRLVEPAGVVDDVVLERDAALRLAIRELEITDHTEILPRRFLRGPPGRQGPGADIRIGHIDRRQGRLVGRRRRAREPRGNQSDAGQQSARKKTTADPLNLHASHLQGGPYRARRGFENRGRSHTCAPVAWRCIAAPKSAQSLRQAASRHSTRGRTPLSSRRPEEKGFGKILFTS